MMTAIFLPPAEEEMIAAAYDIVPSASNQVSWLAAHTTLDGRSLTPRSDSMLTTHSALQQILRFSEKPHGRRDCQ